jgi:enoyl-CoA hydratase
MSSHTTMTMADGVATLRIDDGKVNALSTERLTELLRRTDEAEVEGAILVLTGRGTNLSAGFDIRCPAEGWPDMVRAGAHLAERLLTYPRPVLVACNGSAVAMGAFLLLAADVRIGVTGEHRIGLNEVAIGLTLPWFGIELARHRLTAPYFDRCTTTGVVLDPAEAVTAGFLDRTVAAGELEAAAAAAARDLAAINADAHRATKLRVRERVVEGVRAGAARIVPGRTDW